MSKKQFLIWTLLTLLIIALLAGGGFAAYRFGYSQGYAVNLEATIGEEGIVSPWGFGYPGRYFGPGMGFSPFPHVGGLLFGIGIFILILVLIGKSLRYLFWRTACGPEGAWARGWHRHHGPIPPWYRDWEEPSKDKGGSSAEANDAMSKS